MYTHIHIYIYIYIYICVCVYIYIYIYLLSGQGFAGVRSTLAMPICIAPLA